jgi:threonyl-tRNA synthetase
MQSNKPNAADKRNLFSPLDAGYELLYTPHIANLDLWKTSGHFDFYQESMFDSMDVDEINLSTRPEKSVGADEVWELATSALIEALDTKGWNYSIDEGGGAFYGPKIDLKIKDAIGRLWQCSTIQVDFNLPERFEMEYVAADNTRKQPIMIHRAIFGSLERFFGILIENYAGNFQLWLAPIQLRLLPVTEEVREYCDRVITPLKLDRSHERLGKMIRTAELEKIPVVGVIGMKEMETQTLSIRTRKGGDLGVLSLEDLQQKMHQAIKDKSSL